MLIDDRAGEVEGYLAVCVRKISNRSMPSRFERW